MDLAPRARTKLSSRSPRRASSPVASVQVKTWKSFSAAHYTPCKAPAEKLRLLPATFHVHVNQQFSSLAFQSSHEPVGDPGQTIPEKQSHESPRRGAQQVSAR